MCRRAIDGVSVPGEDHLTLLGDLEPAGDRARGLGEHGPVGRAAAASQRTAATVEQGQPDGVPARPRGQPGLGVVERERG